MNEDLEPALSFLVDRMISGIIRNMRGANIVLRRGVVWSSFRDSKMCRGLVLHQLKMIRCMEICDAVKLIDFVGIAMANMDSLWLASSAKMEEFESGI